MDPVYHQTKKCSMCHKEKLLTSFHKKKTSSDGLRPDCKDCHCARNRIGPPKPIVQLSLFFKTCTKCNQEKPFDQFGKTNGKYRATCKGCNSQQALNYYHAHRDKQLPQKREYYYAHAEEQRQKGREYHATHREEMNQKLRNYRIANYEREIERKRQYHATHREQERQYDRNRRIAYPERVKETQRRYYAAHGEQERQETKRWRQANPLKAREHKQRRAAREKNGSIDPVSYEAILERDGMHCYICNQAILPCHTLHFDHIVPLARGGSHSMDNIAPTHAVCNQRKHSKLLSELDAYDRRGV